LKIGPIFEASHVPMNVWLQTIPPPGNGAGITSHGTARIVRAGAA
jgi:hypothetical protein